MTTMEKVQSELVLCEECGNIDLTSPCNICLNKKEIMERFVLLKTLEICG